MTRHYYLFGILCLIFLINGCAINPVTGERDFVTLSESEEIAQGTNYHKSIIEHYGIYDDPKLQTYVNQIGQQLAAKSHRSKLKFHFTVLDSPDINAFALPGGYIYITRGIMAFLNSEAELAGVLGHEIGHVTARHSVRQQAGEFASSLLNILLVATTGNQSLGQLSSQLSNGIVRGYGREHELEADKLGAQYLHKIGYNPETMLEVIGVLKDQEVYEKALAKKQNREPRIYHGVYSTHPKNDQRLKTVIRAAKKLSAKSYQDSNTEQYHSMIDGLNWGHNIRQGVVIENSLLHARLGFSLRFPPNWQVINTPEAVIARDFDKAAFMQMLLVDLGENETLESLLKRQIRDDKLKINFLNTTASAITQVSDGKKEQPARVSAIQLNEKQAIFILATSPQKTFASTDIEFEKINQSFTTLNDKQIAAIKPPKLHLVKTKADDSFAALARSSTISYDAESILRLLNRAFPSGNVQPNQILKVIRLDD